MNKPSERIVQIAFAQLGHALGSRIRPEHQVEALIRYLDEQHELERRRRAFARAYATFRACDASRDWSYSGSVNAELERAGLKARISGPPYECERGFSEALAEAELEGLL